MGYIFDAMKRKGEGAAGPDERAAPASPPLPTLDEIDRALGQPSADLDEQLDALNRQVETINHALAEPEAVLDPVPEQAARNAVAPDDEERPAIGSQPADDLIVREPVAIAPGEAKLDERLVLLTDPSALAAEEYRSIRTQLLARCEHKRRLVHTITSATPQEGKTITSLNLGLAFAELRNRSTIVVEADLRLPTFAKLVQLPESPGMIAYLRGEAELDAIIRPIPGSRLHVISAGARCGTEAIQLLSSARMSELLRTLRQRFDHVIIDTPPVTELADAGILGAMSDEVMLVVRMGRTPQKLVEQAVRTLRGYHAPVAGLIATDQERARHRYHYYRYGYRYRYYGKDAA